MRRLLAVLPFLLPLSVHAAEPQLAVQGFLRTVAGGPVPDGDYAVTVRFYAGQADKDPLVVDIASVKVQGGLFATSLGAIVPLSLASVASGQAAWVGVTVGTEPELPRVPFFAVPYAVRAQVAATVQCSGCVGATQIDPAALAPYAKAAALAGVALSGNYADLNGKPVLAKLETCPPGQVAQGLGADGAVACVKDAVQVYTGKDFAPSNQACQPGAWVKGVDTEGKLLCEPPKKLTAGPATIDPGKSLILQHNLDTLDVVAQAWLQDADGGWTQTAGTSSASAAKNVAALANGGKCIAQSSSYSGGGVDGVYGCNQALDGVVSDGDGNAWATQGEGAGSYLTIQFDKPYKVDKLVYTQRNCSCEWNQQLRLEFADGSKQTVVLQNSQGPNSYTLTPVTSSSVKIVVETVYGTVNNGASEIEVWGATPAAEVRLRKTPNLVEVQNLTGQAQTLQLVVRP